MLFRSLPSDGAGQAFVATPVSIDASSAALRSVEGMLAEFGASPEIRSRVARAIVDSSRKYNVDPRLVTSVMLVESGANPFAVSTGDSVGIMQIHVPTWGAVADKQGINLFKIEDNVDLGVRILKGYIAQNGVWEGVKKYKGISDDPVSQQSAEDYVQKVRQIYGLNTPA